ncbi:hypothetical protein [Sphingobium sp. YR768]|uniref:hypothetical protein n=1 Tax=Sphingobium sp. YR768 TaxID=1884365 RepID=UPI0008BCB02C|nr:hypothetical protein [Sphingobium sp. YR768]SES07916.1 hypothetical protein SAMN05518866_1376 [Sphingobium sp. YR768]
MNDMVDMSQFVEAKSDQLNADDLMGAPRTITVRKVAGNDGDQPVSIFYEGDNNKPFKPCKTIRRILLAIWGRNAAEYVGRSMTLYRDDGVTFGGLNVGGIRISHMSHMDKETMVVVMKTKGKKAGIKVLPLQMQQQRQPDPAAAANWANEHMAHLGQIDSLEALNAHIEKGAKFVARLEANRPDLHEKVMNAYAVRRDMLTPGEGKPESEMGEGFTGAEDWSDGE